MECGYSSILTKNVLAYNLAYHLSNLNSTEDASKVILDILNAYEYKEELKDK
jgi:hypothetical protein